MNMKYRQLMNLKQQKILVAMNLKIKAFQESYREKWSLPNKEVYEVTFDTIPRIPTYKEVDCVTETALKDTIKLLGLDKYRMRYGAFDRVLKNIMVLNMIP